mmetsp:Transcript_58333/g.132106  ORF Transcript_58333/g.132106 Transcript_58333/m.132106 type:complete len:342 (-) Transcript_58333:133-1158(-)
MGPLFGRKVFFQVRGLGAGPFQIILARLEVIALRTVRFGRRVEAALEKGNGHVRGQGVEVRTPKRLEVRVQSLKAAGPQRLGLRGRWFPLGPRFLLLIRRRLRGAISRSFAAVLYVQHTVLDPEFEEAHGGRRGDDGHEFARGERRDQVRARLGAVRLEVGGDPVAEEFGRALEPRPAHQAHEEVGGEGQEGREAHFLEAARAELEGRCQNLVGGVLARLLDVQHARCGAQVPAEEVLHLGERRLAAQVVREVEEGDRARRVDREIPGVDVIQKGREGRRGGVLEGELARGGAPFGKGLRLEKFDEVSAAARPNPENVSVTVVGLGFRRASFSLDADLPIG